MVCHCRCWTIRNNSSNISAVLHSKPFYKKTKCYSYQQSQVSKTSISHNTCYCHLKGVKPKLFTKPKKCPCENGVKAPPPIKIKHISSCICIKRPATYRKSQKNAEEEFVDGLKRLNIRNSEETGESSYENEDSDRSYKNSKEKQRFKSDLGRKSGKFSEKRGNFASGGYGGGDSEGFYGNSKDKQRFKSDFRRKSGNFSEKRGKYASRGYRGEDSEDFYKDSSEQHRDKRNLARKERNSIEKRGNFASRVYYSEDSEGSYENSPEKHPNISSGRKTGGYFNKTSKNRASKDYNNEDSHDFDKDSQENNQNRASFNRKSRDFQQNNSPRTSTRLPTDGATLYASQGIPKVQTSKFHSPNTNNPNENREQAPNDRINPSDEASAAALKQIRDFRKDHYFETHSTENLTKEDEPFHKCVHSFELDERFLAKPVNCDEYGQSRCVICGKMMKNPRRNSNEEIMKKFPEYYKHGLAPRKVFIGQGDYDIRIKADSGAERVFLNKSRPNYFNTLALKYQRGVEIDK